MAHNRPAKSVTLPGLTVMQSNFVREYAIRGGRPGTGAEAALAAGYANGDIETARIRASEHLRNEKVLAALRDELTRKLNAAASLGVDVLVELAQSAPPSVRLQAAKELVDRGYGPIVSRNAHIVATTSIEEMLAELDAQAGDALDYVEPVLEFDPGGDGSRE